MRLAQELELRKRGIETGRPLEHVMYGGMNAGGQGSGRHPGFGKSEISEPDNGVIGNTFPKHYEVHRKGTAVHKTPTYLDALKKATKVGDQVHGIYRNGQKQHIGTVSKERGFEVTKESHW